MLETDKPGITNSPVNQTFAPASVATPVPKSILADANNRVQNVLYPSMFVPSFHNIKTILTVNETPIPVFNVLVTGHPVFYPMAELAEINEREFDIAPSRATNFHPAIDKSNKSAGDSNLTLNDYFKVSNMPGKQFDKETVNTDINDGIDKIHKDILPDSIPRGIEMQNLNIDKGDLRQIDVIPEDVLVDNGQLNDAVNGHGKPQSNEAEAIIKPSEIDRHYKNREKVVKIFTDVFVILGKDAKADKDFLKDTEAIKPSSNKRNDIHVTATYLKADPGSLPYPIRESFMDKPQPSFTNIADNLNKNFEMRNTATLPTSSVIDPRDIVPVQKAPPSLLTRPVKPSASIEKLIADPGKMLTKKPEIIVIHIDRNNVRNVHGNFLTTNFHSNFENRYSSSEYQTPMLQIPLLTDIPELFEMQEIRAPPVTASLKPNIQWINVLNVHAGNINTEDNHELQNTAMVQSDLDKMRQDSNNAITFDDALPLDVRSGSDLSNLVEHNIDNNGNQRRHTINGNLPAPLNDQNQNEFLKKFNTANPELFQNPIAEGNIHDAHTIDTLESANENIVSQKLHANFHPGEIRSFISKNHLGKENVINVISRPKTTPDNAHILLGKDRSVRPVTADKHGPDNKIARPTIYGTEQNSHSRNNFMPERILQFDSNKGVAPDSHIPVTNANSFKVTGGSKKDNIIFQNVSMFMQKPFHTFSDPNLAKEHIKSNTEETLTPKGQQPTGIYRSGWLVLNDQHRVLQQHAVNRGFIGLHANVGGTADVQNKGPLASLRKHIPSTKRRTLIGNKNNVGRQIPIESVSRNNRVSKYFQGRKWYS